MTIGDIILAAQSFFLLYFIGLNAGYLALNAVSLSHVLRYMPDQALDALPQSFAGFEPPISILAPAYNEEATIAASVRSFLQMNYTEYEILVINDGSKDRTLEVLIKEFALVPFPEAYDARLPMQPVRAVYVSTVHPKLRVVDKDNGGKADALNAGINLSRNPLFCCVDADSILERGSLYRVVQPFLDNTATVASGGTIRIANGCEVRGGFLVKVGLPRNVLVLFQIVEYLRAFLFGRMGWSSLNAILIIAGAFGLFHKDTVVAAGGYRTDTIGEDMELVVRLHRHLRLQGRPYRIAYVPDPICWTEAPEDLKMLKAQRVRWQRGLSESLTKNWTLLCHSQGGAAGWLAFPFMVVFEWLGPVIEVVGYVFMIAGFFLGVISHQGMIAFLVVAIGFGVLLSVSALLLDEISFHVYPKAAHVLVLFLVALVENLGYRQLNSAWRLIGLWRWARGAKATWGDMTRRATWQLG